MFSMLELSFFLEPKIPRYCPLAVIVCKYITGRPDNLRTNVRLVTKLLHQRRLSHLQESAEYHLPGNKCLFIEAVLRLEHTIGTTCRITRKFDKSFFQINIMQKQYYPGCFVCQSAIPVYSRHS